MVFDGSCMKNWAKAQNSSTAPEAEGLPLNTPSKWTIDQDCLINYAGCDENLKCVGCLTLHWIFFSGTTSNGLISPSSHPIRKLFRMEVEDDWISQETSLYEVSIGLGKSLIRMRMTR